MAPSASLQSRINLFERFESSNPKLNGGFRSVPISPIDHHFLDSDPTSPTTNLLFSIPPIQPVLTTSRPSSPAALGRKSSLIDLGELASPKLKPVSEDGTGSTMSSPSTSESSSRSQSLLHTTPPLPPRKPSISSLKISPTPTPPPPLPKRRVSPVSSGLLTQSSSLPLVKTDGSHTYPPISSRRGASPGFQSRHLPSSSTSSFHSVSLSSDGGDSKESLGGSYEAVSPVLPTRTSNSTLSDWEHDLQPTPKMSQRQSPKYGSPSVVSPASGPSPTITRRLPPALPPKPQPQQLVNSLSRNHTASVHHRPAPLPAKARQRYDTLFERNLPQNPSQRNTSGWRGITVDLLTDDGGPDFKDYSSSEERLDGAVIKQIWSCSRLPRARLREIWNECDPNGVGSLDRAEFAKGMWRIDETLGRARQRGPLSVSKPLRPPAPHPPSRKPKFP